MPEPCVDVTLRNGQKICVTVPVLWRAYDPRDPDPRQWIKGMDAVLVHDLRAFATLHAVADTQISPELRRVVGPTLKTMEQALAARLPEGMALHTHG